ncbi:hypothetical protein ACLOJK_022637, partial [Asimina triloba]
MDGHGSLLWRDLAIWSIWAATADFHPHQRSKIGSRLQIKKFEMRWPSTADHLSRKPNKNPKSQIAWAASRPGFSMSGDANSHQDPVGIPSTSANSNRLGINL